MRRRQKTVEGFEMSDDLNDYSSSRMPTEDPSHIGWKIVRAPANGTMKLIVYSSDILGLDTHYYLGRTGPHRNFNCIACKFLTPIRWKGYLLCQDGKTGNNTILEFTAPAAKALDEAKKQFGTMRGLQIHVERAGPKANSRVQILVKGSITLPAEACPDYSVWPILCRIWGLTQVQQKSFPVDDDEDPSSDVLIA